MYSPTLPTTVYSVYRTILVGPNMSCYSGCSYEIDPTSGRIVVELKRAGDRPEEEKPKKMSVKFVEQVQGDH